VFERRGVSADTALRLTRYFGGEESDAQGWLNLQATYEFKVAEKAVGKAIAKVLQPRASTGKNANASRCRADRARKS